MLGMSVCGFSFASVCKADLKAVIFNGRNLLKPLLLKALNQEDLLQALNRGMAQRLCMIPLPRPRMIFTLHDLRVSRIAYVGGTTTDCRRAKEAHGCRDQSRSCACVR
jgi:hypothetical protein